MMLNGALGVAIFVLTVLLVKDFPEGAAGGEGTSSAGETLPLTAGLKMAVTNPQNWLAGLYIGLLNLAVLLLGAMWGTNYLRFTNPDVKF